MKLNFKELHVFNGLSRATEAVRGRIYRQRSGAD